MRRSSQRLRRHAPPRLVAAALALLVCAGALAQRDIRPGFNLFSKEQDIQLGQEAAAELERTEVTVVKDRELTNFVEGIGKKLAQHAQDPDYPFTFKVVADPAINAFAFPGGPIYINSGLIAEADNEAQLAGVVAHEIGHVVLRHSTNQASRRAMFTLPAMLAAGAFEKKGGLLGMMGNLGLGLGLNSALLKYSRSAERDSDIVGARMMAKAGYNPIEAARFFEKLEAAGGARGPEFLSSHPNPGNRSRAIQDEIRSYPRRDYVTNTPQFTRMQERARAVRKGK